MRILNITDTCIEFDNGKAIYQKRIKSQRSKDLVECEQPYHTTDYP